MTDTPTAGGRIYAAKTPAPYLANAPSTSALSTGSATAANVPGCSVTITTVNANAVVQVTGIFDITTTTAGSSTAVGTLVVDGSTQSGEATHQLVTTSDRDSVAQVWNVPLATAGSHTFTLQGATTGGGLATFNFPHTTLNMLVLDW